MSLRYGFGISRRRRGLFFPFLRGDGVDAFMGISGVLDWYDAAWLASSTNWKSRKTGYPITGVNGPVWSATSFNGAPGVTFDGVDDRYGSGAPAYWPLGAAESTIWAVIKQDVPGATAGSMGIVSYGTNGNTGRTLARTPVATVNRAQVRTGIGASATTTNDLVTDFSTRHLVEAKFGATQSEIKIDGLTSTTVAAVPATTSGPFRIGCIVGNTGFWAGVVRHVVITDGTLSGQNITDLRTFLLTQR